MTPDDHLTTGARIYIGLVIAAGVAVVLHSLYGLILAPVSYHWFLLAGLTLLSGSFTVRIPTIPARLSVSETFVFAAVLLFGPSAATMIVVLDALIISLWLGHRSRRPTRILFNMAAPSVAIWIASRVFYLLADVQPLGREPRPILPLLGPLLVLATLYFLLNSFLIARAVAFEKKLSAIGVWRHNFLWLSLNYFSGASVAALLLPYLQPGQQEFARVIGILLPLLLVSYLTFKTALGRVDDANQHLVQLSRLYLSTIETLAMAIDAKDQITHGHIRRVQTSAVQLAKAMGVTDSVQIKAIEAAALLHDMGKLAVPEYILNKPGALTPAEFEKMKLHSSVGADILSAIEFPYPVVPIVRHHHENWDGSGYPDGLRTGEIPIGARILSVVDCFDALTSDRPYRPRLPDSEAITILMQRRGTMYDPLVVDTFISLYQQIVPQVNDKSNATAGLSAITRSFSATDSPSDESLDDIAGGTEEMLVLYELARHLTAHLSLSEAADTVARHLRRIVPAATYVFYVYDVRSDDLHVAHAVGEHAGDFAGLRIARGERLSGWVAANKRGILNSDPVLDLGEVARARQPRLRSCLSTPLIVGSDLVGVLTVYSTVRDGFNDDHRRILDVVAKQVAPSIRQVEGTHSDAKTHPSEVVAGLPSLQHLERFIASDISSTHGSVPLSLVIVGGTSQDISLGSVDDVQRGQRLASIATAIRNALRGADILFRYGSDEFVVLLTNTDRQAALAVAARIESSIVRLRTQQPDGRPAPVCLGIATAPADGATAEELIAAAKRFQRITSIPADNHPSSIH